MAPEQLEGRSADAAADMWALGTTLYTAAEGIPPFDGPTLSAVIAAILTRPPMVPEHAGPLRDLLGALLAKDPSRRPDAATVARVLARRRLVPAEDSWTATSSGTAKSGPAVVPMSFGEQVVRAEAAQPAYQRLPAEEGTSTVTAFRGRSAPASSVPTSPQDGPRGSHERPGRPAAHRTRIVVAAGSIIVVAAIVLTFVLIKLSAKTTPPSDSSISNGHAGAAPTAVVDKVTSVPASTLNAVGSGGFTGKIQTLTGNPAPLTANGKLSWSTIAADLSNPNSSVAKAVDGTANYITAAICSTTGRSCSTTAAPGWTATRPPAAFGASLAAPGCGQGHTRIYSATLVTTMLDAGVDLRDVQIAARHADPRTTMRYDRARTNLDRHPNYILAACMSSAT